MAGFTFSSSDIFMLLSFVLQILDFSILVICLFITIANGNKIDKYLFRIFIMFLIQGGMVIFTMFFLASYMHVQEYILVRWVSAIMVVFVFLITYTLIYAIRYNTKLIRKQEENKQPARFNRIIHITLLPIFLLLLLPAISAFFEVAGIITLCLRYMIFISLFLYILFKLGKQRKRPDKYFLLVFITILLQHIVISYLIDVVHLNSYTYFNTDLWYLNNSMEYVYNVIRLFSILPSLGILAYGLRAKIKDPNKQLEKYNMIYHIILVMFYVILTISALIELGDYISRLIDEYHLHQKGIL